MRVGQPNTATHLFFVLNLNLLFLRGIQIGTKGAKDGSQQCVGVCMGRSALTRYAIAVAALLVLAAATTAAAGDSTPRLKYRSKGSVCSCETGLGEAEISQAMKRRAGLDRLQASPPDGGAEASKDDGQHSRREADENGK
jgi:hypothetical protein